MWEKIGVVLFCVCQGAKPALLSNDLIFSKNCCSTYDVVSSGDSLGGILIFRSTLVTSSLSIVLSIGSVDSEMLSSSESSIGRKGESEYCNCTGESSDESSDERFSRLWFRLVFLGVRVVEGGC